LLRGSDLGVGEDVPGTESVAAVENSAEDSRLDPIYRFFALMMGIYVDLSHGGDCSRAVQHLENAVVVLKQDTEVSDNTDPSSVVTTHAIVALTSGLALGLTGHELATEQNLQTYLGLTSARASASSNEEIQIILRRFEATHVLHQGDAHSHAGLSRLAAKARQWATVSPSAIQDLLAASFALHLTESEVRQLVKNLVAAASTDRSADSQSSMLDDDQTDRNASGGGSSSSSSSSDDDGLGSVHIPVNIDVTVSPIRFLSSWVGDINDRIAALALRCGVVIGTALAPTEGIQDAGTQKTQQKKKKKKKKTKSLKKTKLKTGVAKEPNNTDPQPFHLTLELISLLTTKISGNMPSQPSNGIVALTPQLPFSAGGPRQPHGVVEVLERVHMLLHGYRGSFETPPSAGVEAHVAAAAGDGEALASALASPLTVSPFFSGCYLYYRCSIKHLFTQVALPLTVCFIVAGGLVDYYLGPLSLCCCCCCNDDDFLWCCRGHRQPWAHPFALCHAAALGRFLRARIDGGHLPDACRARSLSER
jgi:hypothetical protein